MIKYRSFTGMRPIVEPLNLAEGEASFCRDCYLHTSGVDPLRGGKVEGAGFAGAATLYRAGDKFISMSCLTDFVRSPIVQDVHERLYYTSECDDGLRVTDWSSLVDDVVGVDLSSLAVPLVAAVPTIITHGTAVDSATNFVVTYISIRDEESVPSPVSGTVDYEDGVDGVSLVLPATADPDIAFMRVYMAINGDYYVLAEVPATQATLVSDPLDDDLLVSESQFGSSVVGTVLTSGSYFAAPSDLQGLIGVPNGVMAGFTNDGVGEVTGTVHFSEPYQPHAWPYEYRFKIKYKIVGLATVPEGVLVLTEGKPSLITGSTPDVMDEHSLESYQSCMDRRSILDIGDSVLWSSPDGVAVYGGRSIKVLSENVWSREQWQALGHDDVIFGLYENKLVIYPQAAGSDGLLYDLRRNDVTRLSQGNATALLYDVEIDALWLVRGDSLERFNEGGRLVAHWIGKPEIVPMAMTFNSARLIPEGAVRFSLYRVNNEYEQADEVVTAYWSKLVTDERPFRVGSAGRMRMIRLGFELVGLERLRLAQLGQDMRSVV